MADFIKNSRYNNRTIALNRTGQYFITLRRSLELEEDAGDVFVTVTKEMENRPDLVSYYAYSDSSLWWVIYEFNNIRDPLFELKAGQVLRIPEIGRVLNAIEALGA